MFMRDTAGGVNINKKFDRRPPSKKDSTELNEDIRDKEVRLIGPDGEQLGILSSREAFAIALEKKMDLVKIAPQATPPVCKIMDYGKFRYEQQKKEREAKKNQKTVTIKEIRLSLNIEKHDMETKAKGAIKFLKDGDKVKVSLRLRGRELANSGFATEVINRFLETLGEDIATIETQPKLEGKSVTAILSPKN
jgi:translation initiation factor IF-3